MSNRAISAIGFTLGVAGGLGLYVLGLRAVQNHRYPSVKGARR